MATANEKELECDYLVVGAGASPLAFVDTLLTELPEAKVILIDKKAAPGGHWVDAYGYVHLHQPSIVYGLSSRQLEGNWMKLMLTKFTLPWAHRANKEEILKYYGDFVDDKVASKQLDFFPSTVYDFEKESDKENGIHYFSSIDGSVSYKVKVNSKLVDGTRGECIIPHDSPLQFPVDEGVRVLTPNQMFDNFQEEDKRSSMRKDKYVVLGAGKTGMDCVVYLQKVLNVDPANIAWVISQDVWMFRGGSSGNPYDWPKILADTENDETAAALALEKKGVFVRLDENIIPSVFRFPVIQPDELVLLRKVKTVIRRGRATAIRRKYNSDVMVEFGGDHSPWEAFAPIENCVFLHATSPGPFNTKDNSEPMFKSSKKMSLDLLFAPPVSFSMSCMAKIEAARVKGTLDTDFMKRLALALGEEKAQVDDFTDDDLLRILIKRIRLEFVHQATITQGLLFAILDRDPLVPLTWMKSNRLSFLSIPGVKAKSYEQVRILIEKGKSIGLNDEDLRMLEVLAEKIKPLEGM
eukprot:CAMPEP_0116107884 /NCGR_PEP_ID=MMETSP0327-20121206/16470_1 /TAXON_ID=44447 /ORGANISM="Pseudo-nitzschia delicatissima, Strain B596" /LENGTH=522 /DNA_ID=CAMNT_0003600719 /DNA_START=1712 /DNA_END=3280 /DNA_ORIENTATION=-